MSNTKRLRQLLDAARSDLGLTYDDVAARSHGAFKRSTVGNLLTEEFRTKPFTAGELRQIAGAFGADYEALLHAHLADAGLLPRGADHDPPIALPLPADYLARLTSRQRAAVVSVVRAMVDPDEPMTGAQVTSKYRRGLAADAPNFRPPSP